MFKRTDTEKSAADILRKAAETYEERNEQYGDAFVVVGKVMEALMPEGVELKTEEDFRRFHLLEWSVGKLVRYAQNFDKGGHADSVLDASVYLAMLGFEEEVINEKA